MNITAEHAVKVHTLQPRWHEWGQRVILVLVICVCCAMPRERGGRCFLGGYGLGLRSQSLAFPRLSHVFPLGNAQARNEISSAEYARHPCQFPLNL